MTVRDNARRAADLRGLQLEADQDKGRPDLGILRADEPVGHRDRWPYFPRSARPAQAVGVYLTWLPSMSGKKFCGTAGSA